MQPCSGLPWRGRDVAFAACQPEIGRIQQTPTSTAQQSLWVLSFTQPASPGAESAGVGCRCPLVPPAAPWTRERGVGRVFQGTQRCDAAPWHDRIPDTTRRHRQMVGAGQQKPKPFSPSGEQKKLLRFTQNDSMGKDITCILMKAPLLKVYPIFPPR